MHHELNHFLSGVEKKAFRMAQFATKDTDHALDIVQDAMMVLSQKYAANNANEWPALFHRILQNKIIDWQRRQTIKNKIFSWFHMVDKNSNPANTETSYQYNTNTNITPEKVADSNEINKKTMLAIQQLPLRQQQAFLLRQWQGLSIKQTADAMSCSVGSVKKHYSRAIKNLRSQLGSVYNEHS